MNRDVVTETRGRYTVNQVAVTETRGRFTMNQGALPELDNQQPPLLPWRGRALLFKLHVKKCILSVFLRKD